MSTPDNTPSAPAETSAGSASSHGHIKLPVGFPDGASLPAVVLDVGRRFADAGYELALVGGPVRDLFLGRDVTDLDFTTDARPDDIKRVLTGWADALWDIGAAFGTIGAKKHDWTVEITTYRAEKYDADSRKPAVVFGDNLGEDLFRRDFTINAMALQLPQLTLQDPYSGMRDLATGVLRTPGTPEDSFSDDPLRMMRAARFAAQLGVTVADEVRQGMTAMHARIEIVSAERVRDELVKLICAPYPRRGIDLLVDTQLAEIILPELPALKLSTDAEHHHKNVYEHSLTVLEQAIGREADYVDAPNFTLRFAALVHDIGKPATRKFERGGAVSFRHHDVVGAKMIRKRMQALRFDKETTKNVARLVELHMRFYGYGDAGWTDSAVRRYVRDGGDLIEHLHALTRSDVTTKNRRKSARLAAAYDDLETRIAALAEQEELDAVRPDLDGAQIMRILEIPPGPTVGKVYNALLEWRLDEGPHSEDEATEYLLSWWQSQ